MVSMRHEDDLLRWFFERGASLPLRSTFGTTLERAYALAFDSEGRRLPASDAWTAGAALRAREQRRHAFEPAMDTEALRAARVSRRLRTLGAQQGAVVRVLEAYYGVVGARWGQTRHGRIFALYPLTPAGAAFVRSEVAKRPSEVADPYAILVAATELQAIAPSAKRSERGSR
jgi:hypothetical protein